MERGIWCRAGYRCRSRSGGWCGSENVGRSGCCFGAGDRCLYVRRHESRCGSSAGSRSDARAGCGSGRSCRSRNRYRCGWMNGHRNEGRSSGRNEGKSGRRALNRSGGCCGRRNEGRIGDRNSPKGPGDRENRIVQKPEFRDQKPELSEIYRLRANEQRRTMYE